MRISISMAASAAIAGFVVMGAFASVHADEGMQEPAAQSEPASKVEEGSSESGAPAPQAEEHASQPEAPALEEKKAEKPKKPKVICRSVGTTGSRLGGQRICKTKEEWDTDSRRAREETRK